MLLISNGYAASRQLKYGKLNMKCFIMPILITIRTLGIVRPLNNDAILPSSIFKCTNPPGHPDCTLNMNNPNKQVAVYIISMKTDVCKNFLSLVSSCSKQHYVDLRWTTCLIYGTNELFRVDY